MIAESLGVRPNLFVGLQVSGITPGHRAAAVHGHTVDRDHSRGILVGPGLRGDGAGREHLANPPETVDKVLQEGPQPVLSSPDHLLAVAGYHEAQLHRVATTL